MVALLLSAWSLVAYEPAPIRSVVQEGRPFVLAIDRVKEPARVAICAEGNRSLRPSNLLHCVDFEPMRIRFSKEFPEAIHHAAIAPTGDWAVVSGESQTWRLNMRTGEIKLLFADTAGLVAINSKGSLVAVALSNRRIGRIRTESEGNLRVYDIDRRKWITNHNSGIVQFQNLVFADENVLAIGLGGAVYSRARRAYFAAVTLDARSGKATLEKSETPFHYKDDPPRLTPAEIKLAKSQKDAAQRKINEANKLDASGHGLGRTEFFGIGERDDELNVVLNRWAGGQSGGVWSGLHFQLKSNGELSHRSFDDAMRLQQMGDDFVALRYAPENYAVENLFSKAKFEIPRIKNSTSQQFWSQNTSAGLLIQDKSELQLLRANEKPNVWKKPTDVELVRHYTVASPDGRFIAIAAGGGSKIEIRNGATGEIIKQLPYKVGSGTYLLAMAFSPDGNQLAVKESHLQVFSTKTFEVLIEAEVEEKAYFWHISGVDGGWLLGGSSESVMYNAMRGWGTRFDIPEAYRVEPVTVGEQKCLLMETRNGKAYIANAETGEIVRRWIVRNYYSTSGRVPLPPAAKIAFEGKLLVRQIGATGRIALARTSDLKTIATIVPIPKSRGVVGWVLTTADGHWAASKGIEANIEDWLVAYREGEPLSVAAMREFKIENLASILPK